MKETRYINAKYIRSLNLTLQWPSEKVKDLFKILLKNYAFHSKKEVLCPSRYANDFGRFNSPFTKICNALELACESAFNANKKLSYHSKYFQYFELLDKERNDFICQIISSSLAMLMHCNPLNYGSARPLNHRRPRYVHSTYPNNPGLCRLLSEYVLNSRIQKPFPSTCSNLKAARKCVEKLLDFRIYDPSMESGQLLLGIAECWIKKVIEHFPNNKKAVNLLIRAGMEKLCGDVLHGADRNSLAPIAVKCAFHILSIIHNLPPCSPRNLHVQDSLKVKDANRYDAIINNPPWGEKLSHKYKEYLKNNFAFINSCPDTYLAFVEKSLSKLLPGGTFAFVLPASLISTSKASRLRSYFADKASIDFLSLMPKQIFYDASIRSIVLAGRKTNSNECGNFRLLMNSQISGYDSMHKFNIRSKKRVELSGNDKNNWCHTILGGINSLPTRDICPLRDLAEIKSGFPGSAINLLYDEIGHTSEECEEVFRNIYPFSFVPALLGRNISHMRLNQINYHVNLRDFDNTTGSYLSRSRRVLVRRHVNVCGKLSVAPIGFSAVTIKGAITVIPHRIHYKLLASILSSGLIADWIRHETGTLINPSFHSVSINDLGRIPIPRAAIFFSKRDRDSNKNAADYSTLCQNIIDFTDLIIKSTIADREYKVLIRELDLLVNALYFRK